MTSQNIQLLCQYNPENDQLQIVKSQNFNSITSSWQYTITDAVGDIIGSMNTALTEAIKNTGGSKLFAEGRVFIIEVGYNYALNLQEARAKYGEQGYRDELTAIGKSVVSYGVGLAGSEIGGAIGFALKSTIPGKIAGAIGGGIISSGLYENYLEQPLENLANEVFGTNFQENALTSKTLIENNNQTTSITATKTTTSSGKSSVSVSSSDYTKDQLTESSKSLLQQEGKNLVGSDIKIEGSDGVVNTTLLNDSLISAAEKFLAKNTKLDVPLLATKDGGGNSLYLLKSNSDITLSDGSKSALDTVLHYMSSGASSLIGFINHQIEGVFEPIFKELFSTDDSTKDANGDNAALRLTGKILADLLEGKDITDIAQDQVNSVLIQNLLKDASAKLASVIPTGPLGAETAKFVQGTVSGAIINFAIAVAADRRMDSDEYGEVVAKDLISAANDNFLLCDRRQILNS